MRRERKSAMRTAVLAVGIWAAVKSTWTMLFTTEVEAVDKIPGGGGIGDKGDSENQKPVPDEIKPSRFAAFWEYHTL
jgi:hypothetical protein